MNKVLQSDTKVGILPHAKSAEICQLPKNAEFKEIRVATPTGFEPVLPA